jgi:two-component system, chemotaxis family, sensor kinase CheA
MTDSYSDVFKEEAREKLLELEDTLLELEANPEDAEHIGRVFRVMHTIKGSGAMFGFDDIAAFTHEIETVYDKVRDGVISVSNELIDLTLQAKDQIKLMLDKSPQGEDPQEPMLQKMISAFKKLASGDETTTTPQTLYSSSPWASSPSMQELPSGSEVTYRIRLKPSADIFMTGTNPLLLLDELRSLGECKVIAQTDAIPCLEEMNPESCYTCWDIILTTDKGIDIIKDIFIFVEDSCEINIDVIDTGVSTEPEEDYKKLGRILTERGDITEESLNSALNAKKYIGEILVEKGLVTNDKVESALIEQQHIRKIREKTQAKEDSTSSIRVPVEKLDILVNLVGELVTIQARLTQTASRLCNTEFVSIAEEVERLTAELRDNTLNIRMLPIGTTFGRFKRLVRDLSQDLGKEIDLMTEGAETELDKTVIEKLNDPLVHLIRNSIDHGIESPDVRVASGKPRAGTIRLSALHSGAHVIIEIKDDGKGLDREAILAKAVNKGFISPGAELTDKEIFGFIFQPGFSTAREVTNVSGRGVGMDVVKRAIEVLRGSIDIQSEKYEGTTVTIKLPLTLAIVDGLLVEMGDNHFVLPLYLVEECVELTREDVLNAHGRDIAYIRGEMVPYVRLRKEFNIKGNAPPIEQIVVTGINGDRVGFVVDRVIGEHQTVIKNLGGLYKEVEGISGATVLGDGTVALIVDAPQLIKNVEREQKTFQ